jgi:hypothetical protein
MGTTHTSGDRLSLPALSTKVRQQNGEEGDSTLGLKYLDATISTYI